MDTGVMTLPTAVRAYGTNLDAYRSLGDIFAVR
jgi:hypothetical protein